MKHLKLYLSFLAGMALSVGLFSCQAPKTYKANLMSYNVKNGLGMDDSTDYARTAGVINEIRPDVVAIQELDSVTGRSNGTYVLGELAKLTGMYDTYAPSIDYDGGKYGIGMLSKEKPLQVYRRALPGREEARMLLMVEFADYVYCCVHLSLTDEDRLASLPIIKEELSRFKKPVFIAGDWNATPDSPFIQSIRNDFTILTNTNDFTFPADTPDCVLDYIAVSQNAPIRITQQSNAVVEASTESDHRPVVVSLTWTN